MEAEIIVVSILALHLHNVNESAMSYRFAPVSQAQIHDDGEASSEQWSCF